VSEAESSTAGHNHSRQSVLYCPYCGEETLFPAERGWECRSCLRAFSVSFLGLVSRESRR
jgi:ribosomal protein L37AE/L43A